MSLWREEKPGPLSVSDPIAQLQFHATPNTLLADTITDTPNCKHQRVLRGNPSCNSLLVSPSPVITSTNPVDLPVPVDPAIYILITQELGRPPFPIPLGCIGSIEGELRIPLCRVCHTQRPLARDDRPVPTAGVCAQVLHVSSTGDRDAWSPLDVVVVVVECKIIIGEVLGWVTGTHFSFIIWM